MVLKRLVKPIVGDARPFVGVEQFGQVLYGQLALPALLREHVDVVDVHRGIVSYVHAFGRLDEGVDEDNDAVGCSRCIQRLPAGDYAGFETITTTSVRALIADGVNVPVHNHGTMAVYAVQSPNCYVVLS